MSKLENPFSYFFYAKGRWGTAEAVKRVWRFHLHPRNIAHNIHDKYREWKLVDRREKKAWSRTVYAVDRDGDLYLVECPQCHDIQSVHMYSYKEEKPCWNCGKTGETHFHCSRCSGMGFNVYLEDGLRKIEDHREGNVSLPSKLVWDDNNKIHLGISANAPWWWRRREVWRDLQANGMDAHGHKPYVVWQVDPEWTKSQMIGEQCASERAQ